MRRRNIPESAIPIVLASITEKTLKQYTSVYRKWWNYCTIKDYDPYYFSLDPVLNFLLEALNQGLSYTSINSSKAALALLFDIDLDNQKIMKRFLKGVYNKNPPSPKYSTTWDPAPVLKYLETKFPLNSLSLKDLSQKLVMLLALTSAQRMQTLSKIQLRNIIRFEDRIEIKISLPIKTSGLNRKQPVLIFPYFKENPKLCVASILEYYIEATKTFRVDDTLIHTYQRPYHPASAQTISRWVKEILSKSGVDTSIFSSHSVRHATTSTAFRSGVNIDLILNTAGWTKTSQMFNIFYNKPVINSKTAFAKSVLNSAKCS